MRIELERYEHRGSFDERMALDVRHHRAQRQPEEIIEAVDRSRVENPPPPLSTDQIEFLRNAFSRKTPPHELMRWRLRLYCGHEAERRAHFTHTTVQSAFMIGDRCPECGLDATIVDALPLGLVAEQAAPVRSPTPPATTREQTLELRVRELEAEVIKLRVPRTTERRRVWTELI